MGVANIAVTLRTARQRRPHFASLASRVARTAQDEHALVVLLGEIRIPVLPRRSRRTAPCRRSGWSPGNQSGGAHIISPMGGSPSSEPSGAQPAARCDPSFETSEVGSETLHTAAENTTLSPVPLQGPIDAMGQTGNRLTLPWRAAQRSLAVRENRVPQR